MSKPNDAIESVTERSVYALSSDADCSGSPDSLDSAGADFLDNVRRAALEYFDYKPDADESDAYDAASEQLDSVVPIYTHTLWTTFVDLGAYQEDDALEVGLDDLTRVASYALYLIGERLFVSIIRELAEARDEDEDGDV